MIMNQAYLVIRYDGVYDVLQKTLSAPFDVWSSLDETVETTLFGQAFGVFSVWLWQCTWIGIDFQLSALLNIHVAM